MTYAAAREVPGSAIVGCYISASMTCFMEIRSGIFHILPLYFYNVLPGMKAPGADLLCLEPAANGAGRDGREAGGSGRVSGKFCPAPMGDGNARTAWQAAGQGTRRSLKMARRTESWQVVETAALFPSTSPFAHKTIADSKGESNRLCAPIRMSMSNKQDVGTPALGLRRGMRTKEPLELDDIGRGQLTGWALTQKCTSFLTACFCPLTC